MSEFYNQFKNFLRKNLENQNIFCYQNEWEKNKPVFDFYEFEAPHSLSPENTLIVMDNLLEQHDFGIARFHFDRHNLILKEKLFQDIFNLNPTPEEYAHIYKKLFPEYMHGFMIHENYKIVPKEYVKNLFEMGVDYNKNKFYMIYNQLYNYMVDNETAYGYDSPKCLSQQEVRDMLLTHARNSQNLLSFPVASWFEKISQVYIMESAAERKEFFSLLLNLDPEMNPFQISKNPVSLIDIDYTVLFLNYNSLSDKNDIQNLLNEISSALQTHAAKLGLSQITHTMQDDSSTFLCRSKDDSPVNNGLIEYIMKSMFEYVDSKNVKLYSPEMEKAFNTILLHANLNETIPQLGSGSKRRKI